MMNLFQLRHQVVSSSNNNSRDHRKRHKPSSSSTTNTANPQEEQQPRIVLGADDSETSIPDEEVSDELGLKIWGVHGGFTVHPKIATGTNPHPNPQRKTYESTLERVDSERMLSSSNPQQEARDHVDDEAAMRRQAATFLQVLESSILHPRMRAPSICETKGNQKTLLKPCLKRRSMYGLPQHHHQQDAGCTRTSSSHNTDSRSSTTAPSNPQTSEHHDSSLKRDAPPRNRSNEQHIEEMAKLVDEDDDNGDEEKEPDTKEAEEENPTEQHQKDNESSLKAEEEKKNNSSSKAREEESRPTLQRGRHRRVRFAVNPANHHRVWCLTQTFPPAPSNLKHKLWWSSRHLRQVFQQHYDDLDAEIEDDYGYALQEAYASVSHTNHSTDALLHLGTFVRCSEARGLEKCCYDIPEHIQLHKEAILDTQAMMKQDEWVGGMDQDTMMDILRFRSVKYAHPCCRVALKLGQYDHIFLSLDTGDDDDASACCNSDDEIPQEAQNGSRWNASSRRGVDLHATSSDDENSAYKEENEENHREEENVSDSETTVLDEDFHLIFESEDEDDRSNEASTTSSKKKE